jgi:AcrR family transcriptional regulator
MSAPEPGRGRPRDPRTQHSITEAARRLLAEGGYDAVSIESIAREAGVGKPTVYRRWPSKAHVVFDAVFGSAEVGDMFTSSGDFEVDLRRFVRSVFDFWSEPEVAAATMGILADRHRDPELYIRTQQLLDEQTRAGFGELVRSGVDQGLVAPDVDVEMLYHLLIGTSLYATQVVHLDDTVERICSLIVRGTATREPQENGKGKGQQ